MSGSGNNVSMGYEAMRGNSDAAPLEGNSNTFFNDGPNKLGPPN